MEFLSRGTVTTQIEGELTDYQTISGQILNEIRKEVLNGEFKNVVYHGIVGQLPSAEEITSGRYKWAYSDNCLYPEEMQNNLLYCPQENSKPTHWWVTLK